jgi:hypothetical protein
MAPQGQMGQMALKCIFDVRKIFIWAKVSEVSDVAHWPLVVKGVTAPGLRFFF